MSVGRVRACVGALLVCGLSWALPPAARADDESPLGYVEMPAAEDGAWVLASPPGSGRNWGRPVFIRYLVLVAREWRRRHPEGPVLRIGDLSKPDGTEFPPHKTHKDGLTADLFTTRPDNICHVRYPNQELTLELAQLCYDYGARQILYNGDLVTKTIGVAQKYPKHDDHFHVVIDPARVPEEGALLVLPERRRASGAFVSSADVDAAGRGLELAWRVLGQASLRSYRVLFDDERDEDGVLHDSGPLRKQATTYALPLALEHGRRYRWRVELELAQGEPVGCAWQTLTADLQPPLVSAAAPDDDADVDVAPVLRWRYEKKGAAQASYWIELDRDPDHRKVWLTLGPFEGAQGAHPLPPERLRRNKTYHWRVFVRDAHGNQAHTAWRRFETTSKFDPRAQAEAPAGAKQGRVSATALNLRAGPGTGHAVVTTLPKGAEVTILAEHGGWLEVVATHEGQQVRGFVSAQYVELH